MSVKTAEEIGKLLKGGRKTLILAGSLCDEVQFDGKKLLDYVAEISQKTGAPIAATGNTIVGLKDREVKSAKKMIAAEVINYLRYPWQDSIIDQKPETLIFIGYNPAVSRSLVSAAMGVETVILGNSYLEEATYSLPDASFRQWQQSLEQLIAAL